MSRYDHGKTSPHASSQGRYISDNGQKSKPETSFYEVYVPRSSEKLVPEAESGEISRSSSKLSGEAAVSETDE